MPLTLLPVLWKLGKRSMPTLLPCSIVILLIRIVLCFLWVSILFPFVKPCELRGRDSLFTCKDSIADDRENKASVINRGRRRNTQILEEQRENLWKAAAKHSIPHLMFLPSAIPLQSKKRLGHEAQACC